MSESQSANTDVPETLQSLLVAFTLALAFRGFVVEGFVIPTGSMAPTLMGQHVRFKTPDTGYEYAFDSSPARIPLGSSPKPLLVSDPMISQNRAIAAVPDRSMVAQTRWGDRVLVLKYLYWFSNPSRWDVAVFKNPSDPIGPARNYIKRVVGLPGEQILIADGDIFTAPLEGDLESFRVVRCPDHVQESIWQPIYDSDFIPADPTVMEKRFLASFDGPPFKPNRPDDWTIEDTRTWRCDTAEPTQLDWDDEHLGIDDFNAYNIYQYPENLKWVGSRPTGGTFDLIDIDPVADIRLSAAVTADDPTALRTGVTLTARQHRFVFSIDGGRARIEIVGESGRTIEQAEAVFDVPGTGLFDLQFIHVDQSLAIRVDGDEVVRLEYDWNPLVRLERSLAGFDLSGYRSSPRRYRPRKPTLTWSFAGSPVELRRVRLDRDLHYKVGTLESSTQSPSNGERISGMQFATDPGAPAQLGEDQYLMLGDNSAASLDSRFLARPHPLAVSVTGDDSPFVIHRDLIVGKAWCVYFPAPNRLFGTGPAVVPDFGRLRFIR